MAVTLTWHMGPDGDRRTDPVDLEGQAPSSVYWATAQDVASGRWVLVRFDCYDGGSCSRTMLATGATMSECREAAQTDADALTAPPPPAVGPEAELVEREPGTPPADRSAGDEQ